MLNYKGLEATYEHLQVSDALVDKQIERLLEQNLKTIAVTDRPSQLDDELVLDYAGTIDGVAFEDGTAQRQTLVLGSGAFIPGFEQQLIGVKPGDEVDVHVTFPTEYAVETLASQPAVFHCKVHEIRVHEKYAADDTFAREVGGCDSFDALCTSLRAQLQAYVDRQADVELKIRLMDQLCETYSCEITPEQLSRAVDWELQQLEAQLARQNLNLDLYCRFTGKSREQLREDAEPAARKNVKRQRIIAEIAEAEHVEADEASVAAAFEVLCRENGLTAQQLQSMFDANLESRLVRSVIEEKVLDLIKSAAKITVVEK